MKYPDKAQFEKANVFGKGNPNTAYAQYFKGNSFLNLLLKPGEPFVVANVTFEPSCRNNWHGAKKDSYFSHVAVEVPGENTSNEWLEAVSDDDYAKLP